MVAVAYGGLRSLGLQRSQRTIVLAILGLLGLARSFFLPFRDLQIPFAIADWWLWFGAALISLLAATVAGLKWPSLAYSLSLLDVCALGAFVASGLEFFSWELQGQAAGTPVVAALFVYVAIGFFVFSEFKQSQLVQRPSGLVTGEILVTTGAVCGLLRAIATGGTVDRIAVLSIVSGAGLIAWLVPSFLKEKEEHRIVRKQLEVGEAVVPEYTGPSDECPEPHHWSMYDSMTAEVEVLDLLRSIVRALKPKLVVETGTFTGLSSLVIAQGLKENGFGKLITAEFDQTVYEKACARFAASPLAPLIDCRRASSLEIEVDQTIDLLFCDSDLDIRENEVRHFLHRLNPCGLILMHDAGSRFRVVREAAFRLEREGLISVVMVSTPRGLVIAQKREGRY